MPNTEAPSTARARAPFTPEQVRSLNEYQVSGAMHPFTCGEHDCRARLVATEAGWECPRDCGYTQAWAHEVMANWAWKDGHADTPRVNWQDITPLAAVALVLPHPEVDGPLDTSGVPCPWPWEPQQRTDIGQYHCPYCLEMVVGGHPHPDYSGT